MTLDASAPDAREGDDRARGMRALLGRQLHVVRRLAEKGVEIAKNIWRDGTAPKPNDAGPAKLNWLVALYGRAERAVRLAVLLQSRLLAELDRLERGCATGAGTPVDAGKAEHPDAARRALLQSVADETERTRRLMDALRAGTLDPAKWAKAWDEDWDELDRLEPSSARAPSGCRKTPSTAMSCHARSRT